MMVKQLRNLPPVRLEPRFDKFALCRHNDKL